MNSKNSAISSKRRKTLIDASADTVTVCPSMLKGTVTVPPSKSEAHRVIIAAALSEEKCVIKNVVLSDDITATLNGVAAFGCMHTFDEKTRTLTLFNDKSAVGNNADNNAAIDIDCGESGSTIRFLMPIALVPGIVPKKSPTAPVYFTGHGRLPQRPMTPYFDMFDKHGILHSQTDNRFKLCGNLHSGHYEIPGNVSSQFITGLLFALPLLDDNSEITVINGAESKGYIDMTLNVLKKFGIEIENKNYIKYIIKGNQKYRPRDITLEGDFSQAAFFLTAGAIGGDISCMGLNPDSLQGDRAILDILKRVGAKIEYSPKDGSFRARHTALMHGITVDASEIPDLVPILSVLFAFCKGESRIINAGRLRIKESDRLTAIRSELSQLGVNITEDSDSLTINGGQTLHCVTTSSRHDHRIAMSLAIALCRAEGTAAVIRNAITAVRKSYPDFFEVYGSLQQ